MPLSGRRQRLLENQHKPYQCPTCRGEGQVWDRLTQNTDICYGCWGDGRLDTPWPDTPYLYKERQQA